MDYCRPGSPAHGILGFLRRAYWSRSPFPSWGDLPNPRMAAVSPSLTGGSFITFTTEPSHNYYVVISRTSLFLFQIKCSSSFAYYWHFAEHIHFLRIKWNTKQFQLLTLLNLVKRLDQGNKFLSNRKRGYSFFFYPRDFLFQSKKLTVHCPLPCVSFLRIAIRNFHFWKYCDSVFGICRL